MNRMNATAELTHDFINILTWGITNELNPLIFLSLLYVTPDILGIDDTYKICRYIYIHREKSSINLLEGFVIR